MIQELNCKYDGKNIYGKLYAPDKYSDKLPIVILCHGLYANHTWLMYYAEELIKENIICYLFDFCGAENSLSDGDFVNSSILTEKDDLNCVIETISALECVDEERIYLLGHSQGGLVVAISSTTHNIKGLFLLSPAFNVPSEMATITPPDKGELTRILPGLVGKKYILDARTINVGKIITQYEGEVTIFHGSKDNAVPIESSIKANEEYADSKLIILENEKHNLTIQGKQEVLKHITKTIKGE